LLSGRVKYRQGINLFFDYAQKTRSGVELFLETPKGSMIVVALLTALAFGLRFYKINHPDQVV
jgi:hypothetical protein